MKYSFSCREVDITTPDGQGAGESTFGPGGARDYYRWPSDLCRGAASSERRKALQLKMKPQGRVRSEPYDCSR